MAVSQNGWVANDPSKVTSQLVPGTAVKLRVRSDAPGQLLLEVASAYDRLVEDIDNGRAGLDDWGYAERPVRGSATDISNHASGTAEDLNATKHPLGIPAWKNFTPAQISSCHRILDTTIVGGVQTVRWGGDYDNPQRGGHVGSRPDPMHWEINDGVSLDQCVKALVQVRAFNGRGPGPVPPPAPPPPPPAVPGSGPAPRRVLSVAVPAMTGPDVSELQRVLRRWYPSLGVAVDGVYGAVTAAAVRHLQQASGLVVDGVAGPATYRKLGMA